MDCCPSGMHDNNQQIDNTGSDNNYLMKQPVIAEEATLELTDFQMVMLPVNEFVVAASDPVLHQPPLLIPASEPFSDRSFSSYRILLI